MKKLTLIEATRILKEAFPTKYVSVHVEATTHSSETVKDIILQYSVYVYGYSWTKHHTNFKDALKEMKIQAGIIKPDQQDIVIQ